MTPDECALARANEPRLHLLRVLANSLSARYYAAPVYLVGSAVTVSNPRDIDLVIVLPDALFLQSYGRPGDTIDMWRHGAAQLDPPQIWRHWARDCARQGRTLTSELHTAVDFKTQPESCARMREQLPRVRLDCVIEPDGAA